VMKRISPNHCGAANDSCFVPAESQLADRLLKRLQMLLVLGPVGLREQLSASRRPLYGVDAHDSTVAVRHNADGTVTLGRFDDRGQFIPTHDGLHGMTNKS
jgi:hypothetical protein